MREVRVSDVTMKQAMSTKALSLTFKEKLEIAKLLDRLGASVIEIEGIEKPKADGLRIKSIASLVKNSILAAPVKLDDPENIEQVWKALSEASSPRLQVQASVSPSQMEYTYHKKAAGMAQSIEDAIKECAKYTENIEFIAEDAMRADKDFLAEVITKAIEAGAKTVTVCDAAGNLLPSEFCTYIEDLKQAVPALDNVELGIACCDALFMADACSVAALKAGVSEIKASSYPLGIASLSNIALILRNKGDVCQVECGVHVTELKRVTKQLAWICESSRAKTNVLDSTSEADGNIVLTAHDSLESVMECVNKLGYELSPEDAANVYEAFLRIASKKESVGSRELDAIVASAAMQVPVTYTIDNYVINSGNIIRATARVQLSKDGKEIECMGMGDGPIDAAFMAIEEACGRHFELDDFQIQAITEGQEAMAETVVKLVSSGKVYSGRGISTDIVGSSIRAFVNALNKIVYEEQN